jgi:RNA polymerase sigma-70 factor (ECF subfamily)
MDETSLPLLDGLRHGKQEAWQLLADGYSALVRHEVARYLNNPDDVAEVCQEVFQAAHQQIGKFERRRKGSLRHWLRMIARNCAISRLRKHEPQGSGETHVQEMLGQVEEPAAESAEREDEEHIRYWRERFDAAAQGEHSERDLAVFAAVKRDGEGVKSVAERIGLAEAQVYVICSRVTRTLQQFAQQWAELMEM